MKILIIVPLMLFTFNLSAEEIIGLKEFLYKFAAESETIKVEQKTKESAMNTLKKSQSSYFPSLNGFIQGSKTDSVVDKLSASTTDLRTQTYLKLTQNLYNGGSDQNLIESSRLEIQQSNYKISKVYYEVLQTGLTYFFNLLKAKSEIENINLEIANNQKSLKELQRNLSNGLARKSQVKTLEVALANNYVDQNAALNNFAKIKTAILTQANIDAENYVNQVDPKFVEAISEKQFNFNLQSRADLQAAKINEALLQKSIDISKASKLPKLDLSASYYLSDNSKTNSLKNMYSAQLTLSIPMPFGDEKNMPIENNINSLMSAKYQTKNLEKNLEVEYLGLSLDYQNAILQIKALSSAYELAGKNAENLKADFRSGLVSYSEYLNATTTYQQIKRKLDQSKIEKIYLEEKIKLWIDGVEGYTK